MTTRHHAVRALPLVAALAAMACASWRGIDEPQVSLTRVETEQMGSLEQELAVGMRFYNPNEFPLEVHGIRFDIEIDGKPVARGRDTGASPSPRMASAWST
jgi:LEA14-like dessication related protein